MQAEERILRAAEAVFARRGYAGASLAEIAGQAGCAKASVLYYFGSKRALYRAVLADTLALWLQQTAVLQAEAEPQAALAAYVRAKMRLAAERPEASRVFANEVLQGAAEIGPLLHGPLKELVDAKAAVVDGWVAAGRLAPVDTRHLFFLIWAATQTYADFAPQVCAVLGVPALRSADFERATEQLVRFVLAGCAPPASTTVINAQAAGAPGPSAGR